MNELVTFAAALNQQSAGSSPATMNIAPTTRLNRCKLSQSSLSSCRVSAGQGRSAQYSP